MKQRFRQRIELLDHFVHGRGWTGAASVGGAESRHRIFSRTLRVPPIPI